MTQAKTLTYRSNWWIWRFASLRIGYISELYKMKRCIFILPRLKFKWGYGAPTLTPNMLVIFNPEVAQKTLHWKIIFFEFGVMLCNVATSSIAV